MSGTQTKGTRVARHPSGFHKARFEANAMFTTSRWRLCAIRQMALRRQMRSVERTPITKIISVT